MNSTEHKAFLAELRKLGYEEVQVRLTAGFFSDDQMRPVRDWLIAERLRLQRMSDTEKE
jgi:hypothetical protein